MKEWLYDLLNEETRTDTLIVRGIGFICQCAVIICAIKYLLF